MYLLDIDGTLVDTTYLHTTAWWWAFEEAGHTVPMARIHRLVGMGGEELMTTLLGCPDDDIAAAHGRHFAHLHDAIRPLPGAVDLIERLRLSGRRVVAVTSAKEADLPALVECLGGTRVFDDVVHAGMTERAKPAPDLYVLALERAGENGDEAVAVGDARWDVEAAAAAGVACVGVESGGTAAAELIDSGATVVYRDCAEMVDRFDVAPLEASIRGDDSRRAEEVRG